MKQPDPNTGPMTTNGDTASPLFDPERLLAAMDGAGLDAVVAHSRHHYFYLSSIEVLDYAISASSADFVLIPRSSLREAVVTVPMSEWLQLESVPSWIPEKIYAGQFYVRNGPPRQGKTVPTATQGLFEALRSRGLSASRVGFELAHLPVTLYRELVDTFPELEMADATPLLQRLRMLKTEEEIRRIQIACELTETAIDEAAAKLTPGMTEQEFAQLMAGGIVARGAEVLYVQVGAGPTGGLGLPTDRLIRQGEVVRADVAAIYQGYNSDLGRSFAVGTPSAEAAELYRVSIAAGRAGLEAVQLGRSIEDIFQAAMSVWAEAGHADVTRHHVGHGLGLEAHEAPMIRPGNQEPVMPNMVLAVEVPCYVYGLGGFAPEDVVVVGADANSRLTHAPAELPVID